MDNLVAYIVLSVLLIIALVVLYFWVFPLFVGLALVIWSFALAWAIAEVS